MERVINYGGYTKPFSPTTNGEYGRGVVTSMRNFNNWAGNGPHFGPNNSTRIHFGPTPIVQNTQFGSGDHFHHHENCHHSKTPNPHNGVIRMPKGGNLGGSQWTPPPSTNVINTSDHIEVLHGDEATAYLAQQNQNYESSGEETTGETGLRVSFGTNDNFNNYPSSAQHENNDVVTADESEMMASSKVDVKNKPKVKFVKGNGLPMGIGNMKLKPFQKPITSSGAHVKDKYLPKKTGSSLSLCGKCTKCKNLQGPMSLPHP